MIKSKAKEYNKTLRAQKRSLLHIEERLKKQIAALEGFNITDSEDNILTSTSGVLENVQNLLTAITLKEKMHYFECSRRAVDIDDPEEFSGLAGDELSELLCEDRNYLNWMSTEDREKMSGFDIVGVLSIHPGLWDEFSKRAQDRRSVDRTNWEYLIQAQPHLIIHSPYKMTVSCVN